MPVRLTFCAEAGFLRVWKQVAALLVPTTVTSRFAWDFPFIYIGGNLYRQYTITFFDFANGENFGMRAFALMAGFPSYDGLAILSSKLKDHIAASPCQRALKAPARSASK
jgi:hypothetical protein